MDFPPRWRIGVLSWIGVAVMGCSPTFNWREWRPEGTPLQALMPCKPDSATRTVPMLGQPTELHMQSCEAGGLTFAVAWAEVADTGQAGEALDQWQVASLAAIRVTPGSEAVWMPKVTGATTQRGVTAQGRDHRAQALQTQVAYFARGSQVYQAAIYGPKIAAETGAAFFDGLSLR